MLDTARIVGLHVKKDKRQCKFQSLAESITDEHIAGVVQADNPHPTNVLVYYFEIRILGLGSRSSMSFGFSPRGHKIGRAPGWERDSFGFFSDGTVCAHDAQNTQSYSDPFSVGDVIGVGIHIVSALP